MRLLVSNTNLHPVSQCF